MTKLFSRITVALLLISTFLLALDIEPIRMFVLPTRAWEYNDGTPSDTLFETFGPRADRLLVKLYDGTQEMWNALETEEIDVTDEELTQTGYDRYRMPPFNNTINTIPCGSDGSFYILDINNNNNSFLGSPPDPSYPNPVYPNPCSVQGMRKAIAYLCDRNYIINNITGPFGYPIYTPLLPDSKGYVHPEIRPGGSKEDLCYLYSRAMANASLDSSGFSQKDAEGWRIWNATGQRAELKFWIRTDCAERYAFGNFLANELEAIGIKVQRIYTPLVIILDDLYTKKDFHLYTGSWLRGLFPDELELWQWKYYWHPGRPYNLAGCHDADFDAAVDAIAYAGTLEEAVAPAYLAQERFAEMVLSVPLWCGFNYQAVSRRYVGTPSTPDEEDIWENQYWEGLTRRGSSAWTLYGSDLYGLDNSFTFMNMRPKNQATGDGSHMTIRYGLSAPTMQSLNPIYAAWIWDKKVLDLIYESLLKNNPYNLNELIPWLAKTYKIDTYDHPMYGECARVKITLRPSIYWSDGTPLTASDICFSLSELPYILIQRGLLDPVWWPYEERVSFRITDPYNFEMLFTTKNVWVASLLCTSRILPRHIWEPICRTGDPRVFAPDPNFIGSGPWRLKEYVASSHVELVRNDPDSTIQTNLPESSPITSSHGYFRAMPLEVDVHGDGYKAKFASKRGIVWELGSFPININFTTTLSKASHQNNLTVDEYVFIDDMLQPGYPIGNISLTSTIPHEEHFNITYEPSKHHIKIAAFIKEPDPWKGKWINETLYFWVTVNEDIAGSTLYDDIGWGNYTYKSELPSPDIKVDIVDVARASAAFGSCPGHPRWEATADITGDYKIDIQDIARISSKYGWHQ